MTTRVQVDVPHGAGYTVRVAVETEGRPDLTIYTLQPGEVWSGYIFDTQRIVAIEESRIKPAADDAITINEHAHGDDHHQRAA